MNTIEFLKPILYVAGLALIGHFMAIWDIGFFRMGVCIFLGWIVLNIIAKEQSAYTQIKKSGHVVIGLVVAFMGCIGMAVLSYGAYIMFLILMMGMAAG